jgi:hypothetical protein
MPCFVLLLTLWFVFSVPQSMLRGRGGCYKHTFYGIESHRCMETTPSLACANKCVFCWRWVKRTAVVTMWGLLPCAHAGLPKCIAVSVVNPLSVPNLIFFSGTGVWTQCLHLEPLHHPLFVTDFFWDRACKLFAWAVFEPQSSWSCLLSSWDYRREPLAPRS